jgi:hypothetical protein
MSWTDRQTSQLRRARPAAHSSESCIGLTHFGRRPCGPEARWRSPAGQHVRPFIRRGDGAAICGRPFGFDCRRRLNRRPILGLRGGRSRSCHSGLLEGQGAPQPKIDLARQLAGVARGPAGLIRVGFPLHSKIGVSPRHLCHRSNRSGHLSIGDVA